MRGDEQPPQRRTGAGLENLSASAHRTVNQIIDQLRAAPRGEAGRIASAFEAILKAKQPTVVADGLIKAAAACAQAGDNNLEVDLLELAIDLRRQAGPKLLSTADALDRLGQTRRRAKDFVGATALCREALQIREAILGRRHRDLAKTLYQLAELGCELADYRGAKSLSLRAIAIERATLDDNAALLADTLMLIARTETALGDFAAAVAHCEEAVQIETTRYGRGHPALVRPLNALTAVYQWAGRPAEALENAKRVVSIGESNFEANDDRFIEPLCHLCEAALRCGHYHDACLAAEQALAISGSLPGPNRARACATLGYALLNIGEMHRARELLSEVLNFLSALETHPQEKAEILVNLARAEAGLGDCESARQRLQAALALLRGSGTGGLIGTVIQNLAIVNGLLGESTYALALHQEALQIERRRLGELSEDVGLNLVAIGRLQAAAGFASLLEGLVVLLHSDDPAYLAEGFRALAQTFRSEQTTVSIFFEKLAVNLLQSLRGGIGAFDSKLESAFIGTHDEVYRRLGDRLIASSRLPEAQQVLRMLKEQELFQFTRGAIHGRRTQVSLTAVEESWNRRLQSIAGDIKASCASSTRPGRRILPRIEAKRVREAIRRASTALSDCLRAMAADFSQSEADAEATSLPALVLPSSSNPARPAAGSAAIHYLVKPRELCVVVTTSHSQRDHQLSLVEGELNRLIFGLRSALQDRSGNFMPAARRLFDILIAPLAADLTGTRMLAFSLDGVLRYVPMAALHDGEHYLVEKFALLFTTEAVEPLTAPATGGAPRGLGLGSTRAIAGRPALPGVREELEAVIRTDQRGTGVVPGVIRLDDEFTASALREGLAAGNDIVHIASHFVFAVAQEAASYLQLGDGSRLTLSDFVDMRFDGIDLVALSACDTALAGGHHQNGREIESFGALVRSQGARNVVATLWPAADMATAALMRAFYGNRYRLGLALPEALRHAQLSLLRSEIRPASPPWTRGLIDPDEPILHLLPAVDTSHPFYWASYVLMGDAAGASAA